MSQFFVQFSSAVNKGSYRFLRNELSACSIPYQKEKYSGHVGFEPTTLATNQNDVRLQKDDFFCRIRRKVTECQQATKRMSIDLGVRPDPGTCRVT